MGQDSSSHTFDETGGFFDHVAPPLAVRPDDKTYTETAKDGKNYTLNFDRLGGRMPTWLVSPYAPRGYVENYGTDPVTGRVIFVQCYLCPEDSWLLVGFGGYEPSCEHSPAFDHLIGTKARSSAPSVLKNPHPFPDAI